MRKNANNLNRFARDFATKKSMVPALDLVSSPEINWGIDLHSDVLHYI